MLDISGLDVLSPGLYYSC